MMQRAGLDIVAIDVNPLSLLNTIRMSYGKELTGNFIYIDIGAAKTDMTILKDGVLRFTRRLEMGSRLPADSNGKWAYHMKRRKS